MNDLSTDFSKAAPVEEDESGRRWTPEQEQDLRMLFNARLSASQIAIELRNGFTRNAVIGKLHRLGLKRGTGEARLHPAREPRMKKVKPVVETKVTVATKPEAKVVPMRPITLPEPKAAQLANGGRVTIMNLSNKTCKWPIGDPGTEDFHFCGHGPRDGSPYCEYHARIAYQPLTARPVKKVQWNHGKVFG